MLNDVFDVFKDFLLNIADVLLIPTPKYRFYTVYYKYSLSNWSYIVKHLYYKIRQKIFLKKSVDNSFRIVYTLTCVGNGLDMAL